MQDINEKLKNLPDNPGVYIMMDEGGAVIYVGKAKVLKNRVRQYFHQSGNKTEKVMRMVEKIADFRYVITKSEADALALESNLIKKYKPYYNILLKDDKAYPYIKMRTDEPFPSFSITRRVKKDRAKYFGPLTIGVRYRDVLDTLAVAFQVRTCKVTVDGVKNAKRACLNYHMGRCLAPCMGYVTKEEYAARVEQAASFLSGNQKEVTEILEEKMRQASENEDFETAMVYRDRLKMLDVMKQQTIAALPRDLNMDVFRYETNDEYGAVSLLLLRGGKIVGSETYPVMKVGQTEEEVYSAFLMQYYREGILIPHEVVVGGEVSEALSDALSDMAGRKVVVLTPEKGVRRQLVDMASKNACEYMEKNVDRDRRKQAMTTGAVEALQKHLGLASPPRRMECYDISNISGTDKVASMVVFHDGESTRSHYRRFRIKTVQGSNDFASMYEVLFRRLSELKDSSDPSFSEKPDLIVVDGGKGQLGYAYEAMERAGTICNMISLAKREEEVFVKDRDLPIILPQTSVALQLLQRIRDEAHRFAITYHRQIRGNGMFRTALEEIEGVGKTRRQALLKKFRTLDRLKAAPPEEIAGVAGIGKPLAEKILAALNPAQTLFLHTEEKFER